MTVSRAPRRWLLTPVALVMVLAGCAAEQSLRDGQALIDSGRYEEGLARMADATAQAPGEPRYRASFVLEQDRVIASLLAQADQQRTAGDYELAAATYQRVLRLDPRNARAREALRTLDARRNIDEMEKQARAAFKRGDLELAEKQLAAVLALDPNLPDALALRKDIELQHAKTAAQYPRLRTNFTRPVTLEFRDANLKMILDVLSRTVGINFIVDKEVKPDIKATIFVKQVPVEDALDLLLAQSQLDKKVINDNTVLIYPATPAKVREYQDWTIRTFFITNMDVKQAQALIKTMLKTKDTFIDEKLNTLTMRDTPDAVRLAEKLLQAEDQPDAEVVLEVQLLDVSRDRFMDLGIQWPSTFTALGPGGVAAALLSDLRGINSSRVGIDRTVGARAKSVNNDVNTLASPRIRVRSREKAKIHIGDRIPIVNATSIPSTQGPVITETVQYLDTGIKLEVEPTVYGNDDVGIKLNMEVSDSQDAGRTNSGTTLVRVKTTNATTSLRMRDGETQILAGLIRNDHRANADQIPGLGEIPAVGRLFGQHDDTWSKRELVLSITPHIVRNTPYLAPYRLEYGSGTEQTLRARPLSLEGGAGEAVNMTGPNAGQTVPAQPAQAAPPPALPAPRSVPSAGGRSSGVVPPPSASLPAPALAAAATPAVPVQVPPVGVPTGPVVLEMQGPKQIKLGEDATISLRLKADNPIVSTALQIGFDPKAVKILEVTEGPMLKQDGTRTTFSARTDDSAGRVFIGVAREGGLGVTGDDTLVQLRVQGLLPTAATPLKVVVFSGIGPGNTLQSAPLPAAFDLSITEP